MYCPQCGKELPDGAQFCSFCGASVNGTGTGPRPTSPAGEVFHGLGAYLRAYLASPVRATRDTLAKKDVTTPLVLLGIQLIACILMAFGPCAKLSLMSGGYLNLPFTLWFFGGLLGGAICIILFVALSFAGAKILKSTCTFQDAVIACGCHSVFPSALMLIAFVCFLLSLNLGLWLMLLSVILWVALGVDSFLSLVPELESGKAWLVYLGVVCVTVILALLLVVRGLLPSLIGSSINSFLNLLF